MNKLYLLLALGASVKTIDTDDLPDCLGDLSDPWGFSILDCGEDCYDDFLSYVGDVVSYYSDPYCYYYDGYTADPYSEFLCNIFAPYCEESYYESDIDSCYAFTYTCLGDTDCYVRNLCYYVELDDYDGCVEVYTE